MGKKLYSQDIKKCIEHTKNSTFPQKIKSLKKLLLYNFK